MLHTVAYVSFSGAGHRISRRNTGRYTKDPLCEQLFARIAQDENLHMVFYRNVLQAALELAPDETMRAIWDVVSTFQMPGNTIAGFTRRSVQIAMAGIYDLRIHRDEVLAPILRSWDVWDRVGLSAEGSRRASSSAATSRSWIGKRAGSRRGAPRVRLARKQRH
jgi:acyl-[acyl-carrier-protein] desaturase